MERISEAGSLYLNDYQILTEARKGLCLERCNIIVTLNIPKSWYTV